MYISQPWKAPSDNNYNHEIYEAIFDLGEKLRWKGY